MYIQADIGPLLICGTVRKVDESFSHDFGVHHMTGYEVERLAVYAFDEFETGIDITTCLNGKQLERYRKALVSKVITDNAG